MLPKDDSCPRQFGFRDNRGTTFAAALFNDVTSYFHHRGSPVYTCSLDAEKCFDSIWHSALLSKLSSGVSRGVSWDPETPPSVYKKKIYLALNFKLASSFAAGHVQPRQQNTLIQHCFNVGPLSETLYFYNFYFQFSNENKLITKSAWISSFIFFNYI